MPRSCALNVKTKVPTESVRTFKVATEEIPDDALEAFKGQQEENEQKNRNEGESAHVLDAPSREQSFLTFFFPVTMLRIRVRSS